MTKAKSAGKTDKAKKAKTQALLQDDALRAAGQDGPSGAPVTATGPRDVGRVGKTGLAEQIAGRTSLSKGQAANAVDALIGAVTEALRSGKTVGLPGLGTLSVRGTAARQGVRPGTTERIDIPAGKKVGFKVSSTLKGSLGLSGDAADATDDA